MPASRNVQGETKMTAIATQGNGQRSPEFTPADRGALRDLWEVYDRDYDEISAEAELALADDPEFAPLLASMPKEERDRQSTHSREMMARAMLDGEWTEYLADLREQGAGYVRMGLSFTSWFRALGVMRPSITRRMRDAYADEPERLHAVRDAMDSWIDSAMSVIGEAYLTTKEQTIMEQQEAIRELSTPVLTLMDGLLLLPVVGVLDSYRARQMTDQLLHAIHKQRAKVVVIDVTGVAAVDSMVANHLLQAVDAAALLGATTIVTGVSAAVAQTVVRIGVDLTRLRTVADLQGGLEDARVLLGYGLDHHPRGAE
jgi:rsbT co-antagonist protein RsbR